MTVGVFMDKLSVHSAGQLKCPPALYNGVNVLNPYN